MSPLRGSTTVILRAPHPGLHGAEGHRMDPTHLRDLSDGETAGIARRQVTARLLGVHLEADAAPCCRGPATTASTTPSLHVTARDPGSNPSVRCPLRDSCLVWSPFIIVGRGRCMFCSSFTSQTTAPVALLKYICCWQNRNSFLNNRDRHFLSEKGASETVILSPRHSVVSPLQKQFSRKMKLFTLDREDDYSHA